MIIKETETLTPVLDTPAPVLDTPTPVLDTPTPVSDTAHAIMAQASRMALSVAQGATADVFVPV